MVHIYSGSGVSFNLTTRPSLVTKGTTLASGQFDPHSTSKSQVARINDTVGLPYIHSNNRTAQQVMNKSDLFFVQRGSTTMESRSWLEYNWKLAQPAVSS